MPTDATAIVGAFNAPSPQIDTLRFLLKPLAPPKLRELATVLLRDAALVEQLDWVQDRTESGACREAFLLELQATAGSVRAWGIVDRDSQVFVGAVLARQCIDGIELEVLCASAFWGHGICDEVGYPVAEWVEDNTQVDLVPCQ